MPGAETGAAPGQCQRQEKPAQHFPLPDVVSPRHKIKRLRRNMKRGIDFSFCFFLTFSLLSALAGPPGRKRRFGCPSENQGQFLVLCSPPQQRSQTSPPLFECPSFGATSCGHPVPRMSPRCWRRVTAPIPVLGCLGKLSSSFPPSPARSLPDDPRTKLSRLLRVSSWQRPREPCDPGGPGGAGCQGVPGGATSTICLPKHEYFGVLTRSVGCHWKGSHPSFASSLSQVFGNIPGCAQLGLEGSGSSPHGSRAGLSVCAGLLRAPGSFPARGETLGAFSASLPSGVGRSVPWLRVQTGWLQPGYLYPLLQLSSRAAGPRAGDLWDELFIQLHTEQPRGAWRVKTSSPSPLGQFWSKSQISSGGTAGGCCDAAGEGM